MAYAIRGYYGKNFSGLAESIETWSEEMASDTVWEYANKGYFIEVDSPDGIERFNPDYVLSQYE